MKPTPLHFLDLKRQTASILSETMPLIEEVIKNTAFSGGPYVEKFEQEFAKYCGVEGVAAVSNGTDALHLAMRALGIGPGDEVIVPADSFIATAWGATHAGATPVFADCEAGTWNIDPAHVEKLITSKTKAVIGVHLYGQPFDIDRVLAVTRPKGVALVEDCAQAQGAIYKGKRVGGFGDLSCFSFYPGKNLGAFGEAGAVATNNLKYLEHLRRLRNHGSDQKYYHREVGFNMRMDGIQGAVLSVKLKHLDRWNSRRQEIAKAYTSSIKNPLVQFQKPLEQAQSVYHLFVLKTKDRNHFMDHLKKFEIFAGLHYPVACHLQDVYRPLGYRAGDCPQSESLAAECVSLPMYPEMNEEEVSRVIQAVNEYQRN